MKICPVCKSRCFDDMQVCYGCMHRFDAEEPEQNPAMDAAPSEGGELSEPRVRMAKTMQIPMVAQVPQKTEAVEQPSASEEVRPSEPVAELASVHESVIPVVQPRESVSCAPSRALAIDARSTSGEAMKVVLLALDGLAGFEVDAGSPAHFARAAR